MSLAMILQIIALAESAAPGVVTELRSLFAKNPTATVDELVAMAKSTDATIESTADAQIAEDKANP